jgi:hypothetical protein
MTTRRNGWRRWSAVILALFGLTLLLGRSGPPTARDGTWSRDLSGRLNMLTFEWAFNFFTWEVEALSQKLLYGLLAPQHLLTDEQQSRFVLAFLDDVWESRRLSDEIDRLYTDPDIADADLVSADQQAAFHALRRRMARHAPIAEMILEAQVSQVLADAGFGWAATVLPPVSGTFTPLPHILVVSPRAHIESVYQQQLIAGLTATEQVEIEDAVVAALPDYASYVTNIGGLAAYPAMLLESADINWVADVMAHEWVHHYLTFYPLGWQYLRNGEARTINETAASLIGNWAGREVVLRLYDPLLLREKPLPDPLTMADAPETQRDRGFDFRAEMAHTRVTVDRLLAEGKITEAEWYMEAQRRYFVAQGYRIRKLNQAYFAFHGAYAATPGGAAGVDPIGPLVRRHWALSDSPAAFLRELTGIVTRQALEDLVSAS